MEQRGRNTHCLFNEILSTTPVEEEQIYAPFGHIAVPWYTDVERYCVSSSWDTDVIQNHGSVTRYSILVC
ncbi:hypothetical protein Natpe_2021 [Natrinema pellirubrum DSM 15624]|uniref:Uncharacterized protein n=1 Tax=Natrinema pellirubrum (strain DSM 15624 / CIP 106293 / JCM 10476 / NCIMB 786 / 157) TaxID=797303 RepID=L0JNB2_NATP1|nr:hypothetical protein Natpe_2021 [Natrinema pellirubrum DSM 15624]